MHNLYDDSLVVDCVIPGSHDSGCYDMTYLGKTQYYNIGEQLEAGIRYFDVRIRKIDEDKYKIYHSIINGVDANIVLEEFYDFIKNNKSEFLILDFQHFENSVQYVIDFVNKLHDEDLVVCNDSGDVDTLFISKLKVSDARGKCIILFGDNYKSELNYIFERNNDSGSISDKCLDSYYYTELNSKKSKYYINNVLGEYINTFKKSIDNYGYKRLFVLQGQLTDKYLIFGPYSKEKTHNKNMSKYINDLRNSEDLEYINIIMRDFVNDDMVIDIINLNEYKKTGDVHYVL